MKNVMGIFISIALNLDIALGSMSIFIMILPLHENMRSFPLLTSSQTKPLTEISVYQLESLTHRKPQASVSLMPASQTHPAVLDFLHAAGVLFNFKSFLNFFSFLFPSVTYVLVSFLFLPVLTLLIFSLWVSSLPHGLHSHPKYTDTV